MISQKEPRCFHWGQNYKYPKNLGDRVKGKRLHKHFVCGAHMIGHFWFGHGLSRFEGRRHRFYTDPINRNYRALGPHKT